MYKNGYIKSSVQKVAITLKQLLLCYIDYYQAILTKQNILTVRAMIAQSV
jgi:hypothetical protein